MVGERRLTQRHRVRHQVDRRAHVIPAPGGQRHARRDDGAAVEERQRAGLVEHQREAGAPILRPRAHDDLPRRLGPDRHAGGLDERLQGIADRSPNACGWSTITYEPASMCWGTPSCSPSMDVGRWTVLRPGLSGPVSPLTSRTISGAIAPRTVEGPDHEANVLARRHGEGIRVAEHAGHRDAHGCQPSSLTVERRHRLAGDGFPAHPEGVPLGGLEAGRTPRRE